MGFEYVFVKYLQKIDWYFVGSILRSNYFIIIRKNEVTYKKKYIFTRNYFFYPHRGNRSFEIDSAISESDLNVVLLGVEKSLASNNHLNVAHKCLPKLPTYAMAIA